MEKRKTWYLKIITKKDYKLRNLVLIRSEFRLKQMNEHSPKTAKGKTKRVV